MVVVVVVVAVVVVVVVVVVDFSFLPSQRYRYRVINCVARNGCNVSYWIEFYRVLPGFYWVLLGLTGFY